VSVLVAYSGAPLAYAVNWWLLMIRKLHLVGLVVAALGAPARASYAGPARGPEATDEGGDADVDDDGRHVAVAAAWAGLELAIPGWYYWHTQKQQEVDWTRPSWKDKLTLHSVRFDTNPFHVNAIRHPLTGIGDYQIARSNGFGMLESTLFAYLAGAVWEFCVEYNEDPALNDLIMNGAGGLAIGEPFYQIGQLWRGGELSLADRLHAAAFSPFAATQDLWRTHRTWHRRRAWSDFAFIAGAMVHRIDDGSYRREVAFSMDIDVVRHAGFLRPGPQDGRIAPGAWSRVALGMRLGDLGAGSEPVATSFRSRTAIAGTYTQDDAGNGQLLAIGTAFTYRRDRLAREWDHLAIAHLIGPQLQLSQRDGETELRWDLAAFADFGMVTAHVFGPESPLPPPPPYLSTLQVEGYYDGAGASIESRVRAAHGPWHAALEVTGHHLWSLDFADRVKQNPDISRTAATAAAATATTAIPATPHGVSDLRIYGHAEIGMRQGPWGIAATADAAYRSGSWRELERTTSDWMVGILTTANFE
jgi:hypothetical protein